MIEVGVQFLYYRSEIEKDTVKLMIMGGEGAVEEVFRIYFELCGEYRELDNFCA